MAIPIYRSLRPVSRIPIFRAATSPSSSLAVEVDLGGADVGMACEFPHLVQSTVTMHPK